MAKDQKSLQKLTVFEKDTYQQAHQEETTELSSLAEANAYISKYLNDPNLPESTKDDLRNQQWENNHSELVRAIGKLTEQTGRMPSINQIGMETGLSRQTIHKHLREFYQSGTYQSQLSQYKVLSDRLLAKLYQLAMEGDVRAAKVFLDAFGNLSISNRAGESRAESVNYIQVNNNVKIDQVTFTNLPEAVQQQIATLVLQGLQSLTLNDLSPRNQPHPDAV